MEKQFNKRKYFRSGCQVPVEGKSGDVFDRLQTVDFSKRGLGLLSVSEVPVGKIMAIELNLNEYEDPVLVVGKITWCRFDAGDDKFRVGVEFIDVLRGSKGHLDQYFKMHNLK